MIENKYRFLIRLVRYSRDRSLLFLSSQTGMNAKEVELSCKLKLDDVVLLFEALRTIFRLVHSKVLSELFLDSVFYLFQGQLIVVWIL